MNILLLKDIINSFFHNHYIVAVVKVLLIEYIYLLNKKIKNVTCLSNVFLLYHTVTFPTFNICPSLHVWTRSNSHPTDQSLSPIIHSSAP